MTLGIVNFSQACVISPTLDTHSVCAFDSGCCEAGS